MGRSISLQMPGGGEARAYLAVPEAGSGPGVLLLHEIAGVNFHLRAAADFYAGLGYVVLAPNLFWRLDPVAENDYSKEGLARAEGLMNRHKDEEGAADLAAIAAAFRKMPQVTGKVAAMGYCFGGRMAYLAGADSSVDAVAGFYPTWVERCLDQADRIKCPMSLHFPEKDALESPDATAKVIERFKGRKDVECFLYPGAGHAFDSYNARPVYNRFASQLANSRVALFLRRTIGVSP